MLTINNIIVAGQSRYELSKNQPQRDMYSNQNNTITDTFSKGTIEKDIRYSFSFNQRKFNPEIAESYGNVKEKGSLFDLLNINGPKQEKKKEKIEKRVEQPRELYNLIGADIDQIQSNNNKMRNSVPYHYFQNMNKDATKEYKMLLYYYNSKTININTFA
jgi:hypothetical protein